MAVNDKRNSRMFYIIALISGLLFGFGMVLSGMIDPQLVTAFLDVTGAWQPDLAFVMGGALLVFMPMYFLFVKSKEKPISADNFMLSALIQIDKPLMIGAALFGLGWGLAGICPGPAVASLALGNSDVWVFFVAMLAGNYFFNFKLFTRK